MSSSSVCVFMETNEFTGNLVQVKCREQYPFANDRNEWKNGMEKDEMAVMLVNGNE